MAVVRLPSRPGSKRTQLRADHRPEDLPWFRVAEELGLRAARVDGGISLGQGYGYDCRRAYPVHEDYTDRWPTISQPWEASPSSRFTGI